VFYQDIFDWQLIASTEAYIRTRFIGQQRVTRFLLHPTISGHFEGGNLITSGSVRCFIRTFLTGSW